MERDTALRILATGAAATAVAAALCWLQQRPPKKEAYGPTGNPSQHKSMSEIQAAFARLPSPPKDNGKVTLLVIRHPDGRREELQSAIVTPEQGLPGDRWARLTPNRPDAQVTIMRHDIASILAGEQPVTFAGDQMFVDLDLSAENLPIGSRCRVGEAEVVVTKKEHNGCAKFINRFGQDAMSFVNMHDLGPGGKGRLNYRGIYWLVTKPGEVRPGSRIEVLERA